MAEVGSRRGTGVVGQDQVEALPVEASFEPRILHATSSQLVHAPVGVVAVVAAAVGWLRHQQLVAPHGL